jgi:protein involved in polysaccharide export with SLBB domain
MHESNLICPKRLTPDGSEFPLLYLCRRRRRIIPRLTPAIVTLLCIGGVGWAQTAEAPNQQPQTEQQRPEAPFPQTRPLSIPRITNTTPAQERLEQARSPQKMLCYRGGEVVDCPSELLRPLPEPDLEFQEFVASSLGTRLPIFGQTLFENVPSTFAPLDRVQVPADYVIGPDDQLLIRAWGQVDINWLAIVDRGGSIYIPQIGSMSVAGLKYAELHDYFQAQIGRIFKNFQLSVSMGQLRSIQVFVVGQIRRPGAYTISSLSSLVDALFASSGPSKRGSMRRIQLRRDGKIVTTFDLYDLIANGDKSKDAKLMSGDVIYVPPVGPLVALAGSVNTPAVYELKEHATLGEVVGYAGGLTNTAAGEYAVVERIDDHHVRRAEEFPLNQEGLGRELHDGDVVRFLRISSKFENAVTLRGNIAVPGRYPWHDGMRVHDLIPDRDFLVTDEYWKRQNQLAVDARAGDFRINQAELKNDVKRLSAEINWEYAVIQRFDPQTLSSRLLPFNLGKAIEGDTGQNLVLQVGDIVTVFSQADIQVPIGQQSKFMHLEGEIREAGVYQIQQGETLRHLVARVGGFTPQAYLYGAEFTRESTRVDQQQRLDQYVNELDKSLQRSTAAASFIGDPEAAAAAKVQAEGGHALVERMRGQKATGRIVLELKPNAGGVDALPDLVLEDGDRLLVPFRPATVNVIGSVYNSNAFVFKPGKNVADYLRLAGGTRRDGDKGREFVLRADGSTVSRQQHHAFTGRNFSTLRLMPGDTIIVPEKIPHGAAARAALRDWATILGQLGLAAGGIRSIFP